MTIVVAMPSIFEKSKNLFCISTYCCIRQVNLYDCQNRPHQLLYTELIYKHEFQNLAMTHMMNMQEIVLTNSLLMKKH